jgi:hypothetical protein
MEEIEFKWLIKKSKYKHIEIELFNIYSIFKDKADPSDMYK